MSDFMVLDDDMEDVEGEIVHTDTTGVSVEKGVAIKDVEDSHRPIKSITTLQPIPTIDPKDKGKGVLVEEEPEKPEKYTIKERARLLAEFFERRKKKLAAERAEAIRNKPPTRTQVRNRMITYLKHMVPRDDVAIDVESLATKYPIVDWKTHILNENMMYYQIIRADGSYKNYKIFSEMLDDLDRQDVIDLHRMQNRRLKVDYESEMAFELLRFTRSQLQKLREDCWELKASEVTTDTKPYIKLRSSRSVHWDQHMDITQFQQLGVTPWKTPSRDFTRPLGPPIGLKGLLHMLNATVIPTKGKMSFAHDGDFLDFSTGLLHFICSEAMLKYDQVFALEELDYGWTVATP
ncbi:hypothetical protein Tco_0686700 [Tanacetum coccineum]